jgi:hypothetical protein
MFFIVDTFVKVLLFEIGVNISTFILPIVLHAYFGVPYIN